MDTRRKTTQAGFNMLELLMTIAIAAIVAMIGIPSFRYVTNSNRVAGEVNGLLGDLQFARAEAIKEGEDVTVCVSSTGTSCDGTTTWQSGWIVYSNTANSTVPANGSVLRVQSPFTSTDTFGPTTTTSAVTFNREGYAVGIPNGSTVFELHVPGTTTNWNRCLSVNFNGMTQTFIYGASVNNGQAGLTCN